MPRGLKGFQKNNKIGQKNRGKKHDYARNNPQVFKKGYHASIKTEFKKGNSGFWLGKRRPKWVWKKEKVSSINKLIRMSLEYKLWRIAIFERDNYTCIWCGKKDKSIQADHIKPFALFPELRFAIDNGRTLCRECHKKTNTWGGNTRYVSSKRCN